MDKLPKNEEKKLLTEAFKEIQWCLYLDKTILKFKSNQVILSDEWFLNLLVLRKIDFVDFPFFDVELLVVLFGSNEMLKNLGRMGNLLALFGSTVDVREVWPATLWMVSFIVNNQVVPETRSVLFVHANSELSSMFNRTHLNFS